MSESESPGFHNATLKPAADGGGWMERPVNTGNCAPHPGERGFWGAELNQPSQPGMVLSELGKVLWLAVHLWLSRGLQRMSVAGCPS